MQMQCRSDEILIFHKKKQFLKNYYSILSLSYYVMITLIYADWQKDSKQT